MAAVMTMAAQNSTENRHYCVDLGLPSGTLWATCNMGASKPESFGNYYAWGETSTKGSYYWNTYQHANGYVELTRYCRKSDYGYNGFTDNLTMLLPVDDPAVAWGSGWRTPSKIQWDELLVNTTQKWTTRNGVKGMLFTSRKNGQTIFLPAADYREGSETRDAEFAGFYWSRSLYTGKPDNAWSLYFFSSDDCSTGYFDRIYGLSVRPIREK